MYIYIHVLDSALKIFLIVIFFQFYFGNFNSIMWSLITFRDPYTVWLQTCKYVYIAFNKLYFRLFKDFIKAVNQNVCYSNGIDNMCRCAAEV